MEKALIYCDNAATVWPKPDSVYRFMDEFYRTHGVNPGLISHFTKRALLNMALD